MTPAPKKCARCGINPAVIHLCRDCERIVQEALIYCADHAGALRQALDDAHNELGECRAENRTLRDELAAARDALAKASGGAP